MSEHFLKFSSGFEKNYELIQEGYRDDEIEYQSKSRMEIKIEKNKYNDFECKMKIIYGESNFCVNSFKTAFVTELYKKYNYYNLILNSENKIIKVKNKREIIKNLESDSFSYIKKYPEKGQLLVYLIQKFKSMMETEEIFKQNMMNTHILSYFFIDIYNKAYNNAESVNVRKNFDDIIYGLSIPFIFDIKLSGNNEDTVSLLYEAEMENKQEIPTLLKKYFGNSENESFGFDTKIIGNYKFDKIHGFMKEMNTTRILSAEGKNYKTVYRIMEK